VGEGGGSRGAADDVVADEGPALTAGGARRPHRDHDGLVLVAHVHALVAGTDEGGHLGVHRVGGVQPCRVAVLDA
jgi:hypothetical protein